MRLLILPLLILNRTSAAAAASQGETSFRASCTSLPGEQVKTMTWEGSFVFQGSHTAMNPTSIKITRREDRAVLLDLPANRQRFLREAELGNLFFGVYDDVQLTAPHQTVYVGFVYADLIGVLQSMALYRIGRLPQPPRNIRFAVSAFAEQDKDSTLSTGMTCDFDVLNPAL